MKGKKKQNLSVDFYTEEKEKGRFHFVYFILIQAVLLYLSTLGVFGVFIKAMDLPVSLGRIQAYLLLAAIIFPISFNFFKNGKYILFLGGIVYLFCFIRNMEQLKSGLIHIMNRYITFYNQYMNLNFMTYPNTFENAEDTIFIFLIYFIIPIMGILSYIIMKRRKFYIYIILTLPFILASLLIGKVPNSFYFFMYFIGVVGVVSTVQLQGKKEKSEYGQVIILTAFLGLIIVFCTKILPKNVYQNEWKIPEVKKDIQERIENSEILKIAQKLVLKNSAQGGIGEGRLGQVESVKFKNAVMFDITLPSVIRSLYLRSYIGSIYNSKGWSPATITDMEEYRPMLDTLLEEGISTANLGSNYMDILTDLGMFSSTYIKTDVIIEDKEENEKYKKVPYFSSETFHQDSVQEERQPFENTKKPSLINNYSGYYFLQEDTLDYIDLFALNNCIKTEVYKKLIEKIIEKPIEDFSKGDEVYYKGKTVYDVFELYQKKYPEDQDAIMFQSSGLLNDVIKNLKKYDNFLQNEKQYREMVYKEYRTLPDNSCEELIAQWKDMYYYTSHFDKIKTGNYMLSVYKDNGELDENYKLGLSEYKIENGQINVREEIAFKITDLLEIILYVKDYLSSNTKYSLNPGNTPSDKDFIEYFLTENKLGYCSYYATAATIMFRSMGIPARYVEGYVVTYSNIRSAPESGSVLVDKQQGIQLSQEGVDILKREKQEVPTVTTSIKDTNAHAWTEIYIDGFGWVPVDVTPGYTENGITSLPDEITDSTMQEENQSNLNTAVNPQQNANINQPKDKKEENLLEKEEKFSKKDTLEEKSKKEDNKIKKAADKVHNEKTNGFLTIFFQIIGITLICFILFMVRFCYLSWNKKRKLESKDGYVLVNLYYKDILRMLPYWKIKDKHISEYTKYCEEVEEKVPFLEKGVFTEGFEVIVKSKFSQHGINEEEIKKVEKCYDCLLHALYLKVNIYERLKLKYIYLISSGKWQ